MTRRATDRLLTAAGAAATGALIGILGGVPEAALLVAPWVVLLTLGFGRRGSRDIAVTVAVGSDRVLVGDEVEVAATVTGAAGSAQVISLPGAGFWPRPADAELQDAAREHDVIAGDRATIRCLLPAMQWGTHEVGRVRIEVTEPYGLFRWEGTGGRSAWVRVHPTTTEVRNLLAPWLVRRVTGAHRSRAVGRGVEYADIRPFASGDTLRDINWRASARSPELWVSQRHPEEATDVVLLLDSFVESGHDVRTVVGLAIEAAVALAEGHLAVTDRVGLVELGGVVRWITPGTGRLQLQRLTDALLSTRLYANVAERDLSATMARVLPPRSFVVALTPLLDDRFVEALFTLAGHGHDVAVIECMAPDPSEAAASEAARLAARFWAADRQMVRDRLSEQGVSIAAWRRGRHLDVTLDELSRHRQHSVRLGRR